VWLIRLSICFIGERILNVWLDVVSYAETYLKKKMTLPDKLTISSHCIPTTKRSFQMLDQESTSSAKGCVPFWNSCTVEWARRLWLPTETDLVDWGSSSWNTSLKNLGSNSWFTVKVKTTEIPLENATTSSSLSQCIMENELLKTRKEEEKKKKASVKAQEAKKRKIQEHNENVAKGWAMEDEVLLCEKESKLKELEQSHKSIPKGGKGKRALSNAMTRLKTDIRRLKSKYMLKNHVDVVEPKPIQVPLRTKRVKVTTRCETSIQTIRKWTGTTRWTYNQCVAYGREHPEIELMSDVDMSRTLRDHVASLKGANPWIEETPQSVYDHGITDYKKAVRSNQAKRV
jgi:hypothetical protein